MNDNLPRPPRDSEPVSFADKRASLHDFDVPEVVAELPETNKAIPVPDKCPVQRTVGAVVLMVPQTQFANGKMQQVMGQRLQLIANETHEWCWRVPYVHGGLTAWYCVHCREERD